MSLDVCRSRVFVISHHPPLHHVAAINSIDPLWQGNSLFTYRVQSQLASFTLQGWEWGWRRGKSLWGEWRKEVRREEAERGRSEIMLTSQWSFGTRGQMTEVVGMYKVIEWPTTSTGNSGIHVPNGTMLKGACTAVRFFGKIKHCCVLVSASFFFTLPFYKQTKRNKQVMQTDR